MKNTNDSIGNQTRELPACGVVSQKSRLLAFAEGMFTLPMTFSFTSNMAMDCQMAHYVA